MDTRLQSQVQERYHRQHDTVTRREGQILDHLCSGRSNKEIARALGISTQTVKNCLQGITRKLDADNRVHAAVLWQQLRAHYHVIWQIPDASPGVAPPTAPPPPLPPLPHDQYFWLLVEKHGEESGGCWIWHGAHASDGFPVCSLRGLKVLGPSARRVAWALTSGAALPADLHLHRTCASGACVNPAHMQARARGAGDARWGEAPLGRAYDAYLRPHPAAARDRNPEAESA